MTTPQGPGSGSYASPIEYVKPAPPMAQPGSWPTPPPVQQIHCRFCGSTPGKVATVHAHRGMVFVMQFRTLKGPFCRDCGIATVRRMSAETLLQGWWGIASFFITPIILLINVVRRIQFGQMPAPAVFPGGPGPMPVGRPVFLRFAIVGALVPVVLFFGLVVAAVAAPDTTNNPGPTTPAPKLVGLCMAVDKDNNGRIVTCNLPHEGRIIAEADDDKGCPEQTDWYFDKSKGGVMCVQKD